MAMLSGDGQVDDVTLLTITSGVFAQASLSSTSDPGFNEIMELGSIAISAYKTSTATATAMDEGNIQMTSKMNKQKELEPPRSSQNANEDVSIYPSFNKRSS